jgi:hypothetical protein
MLVFIPNEQIYGFIHENDFNLTVESLQKKVVLCSPLTLFAILAVIRQASGETHALALAPMSVRLCPPASWAIAWRNSSGRAFSVVV